MSLLFIDKNESPNVDFVGVRLLLSTLTETGTPVVSIGVRLLSADGELTGVTLDSIVTVMG